MNSQNGIILLLAIALVFGACVNELDIDTDREVRILVVEGAMSTGPGPHRVRLTESVKYGDVFDGFIRGVDNAKVSIRDNTGDVVSLTETESGIYESPVSFSGEIGRSYSLLVETRDGRSYISLPEKLEPVPEIDSLSFVYKETAGRGTGGEVVIISGLEVLAHYNDPQDASNYYLWRSNGLYRIDTNPEAYVDPNPDIGPSPKNCCNRCWISETKETNFSLNRDINFNGSNVTELVSFVEDDGLRFTDKYLIRVEQSSISKEAFQFFDLIKEQLSIDGDVFDPPPATVRGNMIRTDSPDENVIGFFRVSDVRIDSLFLFRSDLANPKTLVFIPDDCLLVDETATTERPSFW